MLHKPSWALAILGIFQIRDFYLDSVGGRRASWCLSGKESACNAGDPGSIPGLGRNLGGGHGILAWRNPMNRGAWQATAHRVKESQTWLKRLSSNSRGWEERGGKESPLGDNLRKFWQWSAVREKEQVTDAETKPQLTTARYPCTEDKGQEDKREELNSGSSGLELSSLLYPSG